MTQIRRCEHSDWVVCDECGPKPAPNVSEEDVERVMRILDAAHQDIWMKLKPKTLRSMAAQVVEALPPKMRAADELYEALIAAKRSLWEGARLHWTVSDFNNWAVVQQINAALTKTRGEA